MNFLIWIIFKILSNGYILYSWIKSYFAARAARKPLQDTKDEAQAFADPARDKLDVSKRMRELRDS